MTEPMRCFRARGAALTVSGLAILLGGTVLSAPGVTLAQVAAATPPPPPAAAPAAPPAGQALATQSGYVSRILVQGNERIDPETILSYLPISVGQTVDAATIDLALKALFRTDLFSDVKIDLKGGDLIVHVIENPIINQVLFEGNSNLKEDKLKDEVQIRPRGVFTKAKVEEDVGRIVELYRRSGRIGAAATPCRPDLRDP
jgi:outer membrane protein insertion porin family